METRKNQPFLRRARFAIAGIAHALRTEQSLRTQAVGLAVALIALVILRPAAIWWALVFIAASGVLAAELFNTAVERLADHMHPDVHPEIRLVKDCAAGGVLITSVGAVAVAIALFIAVIHGS